MAKIGKYDALTIEPEILKFWKDNDIHARSNNPKGKRYYFLDGPPYTSGRIHLGTAWNKSLKDMVLRYKRMRGFDVWDRAGYDMHGLPTENATQKKLDLKTKQDIEKFGVDKFIEECKKLCVENMEVMNDEFRRLGSWMDYDNAYQSIAKEFIEGEWWLIKKAHEKGRLYQGMRTMHWCPITESALAKHELEYRNVKDESIFVKLKVKGKENEYLVIWTTTPWTIPLNLAVMANPELDYIRADVGDEVWIVASALSGAFIGGVADKRFQVLEKFKGDSLEGLEYEHPFHDEMGEVYDRIKKQAKKTHTVLMSTEYVDTKAGTGLVHCAPGCGPEDYEVGYRNGIEPYNPLDEKGTFPQETGKFSGLVAKKDDPRFTEALDEKGALIAKTEVEHDYPHDWRYHSPVIFRTTKQWFFKVEDLKDKMVKANEGIKWVPQAAFNAFDSWLKNLRDNSISKQRYWGTPIPIWVNEKDEDDYIVIGSADELEKLSGKKADDLHISTVDKIVIEKDGKTYKRIPDILDVWVDAGTVSWNCLDYPKTEKNWKLFPADFILEGKDQIRGWFNLLMVASTIALDKASFKSCYMHGFVQDSQGRKMSKSLGNVISPDEVVEKHGADTLRYYMIGGANPGIDINYNFEDMKVKNRNLFILWNLHKFVIDYARQLKKNPEELKAAAMEAPERYMMSKLNSTIKSCTELMDSYRINEVPWKVEELFLELSRTYIQIIRDKSVFGTDSEKQTVLRIIYGVLMESLKMFSIVSPFVTEKMHQNLREEFKLQKESIHLYDWPEFEDKWIAGKLEEEFRIFKDIQQAALHAREKAGFGLRWPLRELVINSQKEEVEALVKDLGDIIKNQCNVKSVSVNKNVGDMDMEEADFAHGKVFLDLERTEELVNEGYAREVMRRVQQMRKKAGMQKEDRIILYIQSELNEGLAGHDDLIKDKCGAMELHFSNHPNSDKEKIKGKEFAIAMEKVR